MRYSCWLPLCCDVGFTWCVFSFLSTGYLVNRLHSRQCLLLMCVVLVVVLSLFYYIPFDMVNTCLAPEQNPSHSLPLSNKYRYSVNVCFKLDLFKTTHIHSVWPWFSPLQWKVHGTLEHKVHYSLRWRMTSQSTFIESQWPWDHAFSSVNIQLKPNALLNALQYNRTVYLFNKSVGLSCTVNDNHNRDQIHKYLIPCRNIETDHGVFVQCKH